MLKEGVIPIEAPYRPELLKQVRLMIEEKLADGGRVFEFGSGASTVWLAGMADKVRAVEHDSDWYTETRRALKEAGRRAGVVLWEWQRMAEAIRNRGNFSYDLILIDCLDRVRIQALSIARDWVKPGGWIVLDDSHWPMLWGADELMADFSKRGVYNGLHTRVTGAERWHQTTIYER